MENPGKFAPEKFGQGLIVMAAFFTFYEFQAFLFCRAFWRLEDICAPMNGDAASRRPQVDILNYYSQQYPQNKSAEQKNCADV